MGSIERRLEKLEAGRRKSGFLLADGSRYTYDADNLWRQTFASGMAAAVADGDGEERGPLPDIYKALARAKHRSAAIEGIFPGWRRRQPTAPVDLRILAETGKLVARPLVVGSEAFPTVEAGYDVV